MLKLLENNNDIMTHPNTLFFRHEKTGIPFYEVHDPAIPLHYVQQYDPHTDRGIGVRIAFWEENGTECSASGHAIEETPGDYQTCQWHGSPTVRGTDSLAPGSNPPITPELRRVIYANDLSSVQSSMKEARMRSGTVVDITSKTNPEAAKQFQDKALKDTDDHKLNKHIADKLSIFGPDSPT